MTEMQIIRFREVARTWDKLADRYSRDSFQLSFFPELERLHHFEADFPDENPELLLKILETKVLSTLRREFPLEAFESVLPHFEPPGKQFE